MTNLTRRLFDDLEILINEPHTNDSQLTYTMFLWFRLALVAVTALVDIADSLADMASDRD